MFWVRVVFNCFCSQSLFISYSLEVISSKQEGGCLTEDHMWKVFSCSDSVVSIFAKLSHFWQKQALDQELFRLCHEFSPKLPVLWRVSGTAWVLWDLFPAALLFKSSLQCFPLITELLMGPIGLSLGGVSHDVESAYLFYMKWFSAVFCPCSPGENPRTLYMLGRYFTTELYL